MKHVILFRDGVSEGEYNEVVNSEIPQIAREYLYKHFEVVVDFFLGILDKYAQKSQFRPQLTFIIVTKRLVYSVFQVLYFEFFFIRHHVRFFISRQQAQDNFLKNNCPAGLVVHNEITHIEYPNFYLQSHSGLQGSKYTFGNSM